MMPTLVVVADLVVTSVMLIWRSEVEAEQTTVVLTCDSPSLMLIARFALQFFVFMLKTVAQAVSRSLELTTLLKEVSAETTLLAKGIVGRELIWDLVINGMSST